MSKNENLHVIQELSQVIKELDHDCVSWTEKHFVIDLSQKAQVLLEAVSRLETHEKEATITAAKAFLTEVAPVISELQNQNQEIKK